MERRLLNLLSADNEGGRPPQHHSVGTGGVARQVFRGKPASPFDIELFMFDGRHLHKADIVPAGRTGALSIPFGNTGVVSQILHLRKGIADRDAFCN